VIYKETEQLCGDPTALRKKGGGLWECGICLLIFEEETLRGNQEEECQLKRDAELKVQGPCQP